MAFSVNGIGTVYYGRSGEADDGSYISTLWVVVFLFPILPLRSERIRPLSSFSRQAIERVRYEVIERASLDRKEVGRVLLAAWFVLIWTAMLVVAYGPLISFFGEYSVPFVIVGWLMIPFGVIYAARRRLYPPLKYKLAPVTTGSSFKVYRKSDDEKR